jgi:hypothetical protein
MNNLGRYTARELQRCGMNMIRTVSARDMAVVEESISRH